MRAILMSLKPKWCEKIFNGEKTVEVRKTAPKLEPPFKVYVYCTKQRILGELIICKSKELSEIFGYGSIVGVNKGVRKDEDDLLCGKVVGEFVCDEKHDIQFTGASYTINNDRSLTNGIARQSCLQFDDMFSYLGVKGGAALHITKVKRYDKPKDIKGFRKPCPYGDLPCTICPKCRKDKSGYIQCFNTVNRAPQSWCYVVEE